MARLILSPCFSIELTTRSPVSGSLRDNSTTSTGASTAENPSFSSKKSFSKGECDAWFQGRVLFPPPVLSVFIDSLFAIDLVGIRQIKQGTRGHSELHMLDVATFIVIGSSIFSSTHKSSLPLLSAHHGRD